MISQEKTTTPVTTVFPVVGDRGPDFTVPEPSQQGGGTAAGREPRHPYRTETGIAMIGPCVVFHDVLPVRSGRFIVGTQLSGSRMETADRTLNSRRFHEHSAR